MPNLADEVWSLLNQSFTRRLVLELNEVPFLHSYFIGQLVLLGKQIARRTRADAYLWACRRPIRTRCGPVT